MQANKSKIYQVTEGRESTVDYDSDNRLKEWAEKLDRMKGEVHNGTDPFVHSVERVGHQRRVSLMMKEGRWLKVVKTR